MTAEGARGAALGAGLALAAGLGVAGLGLAGLGLAGLSVTGPALADEAASGRALYETHCQSCHQFDGGGVPNFQPSLLDSVLVAAEPRTLAAYVLQGTADLPDTARAYNNVMPSFRHLSDAEVARLLRYVRDDLAGVDEAEPVTPEAVAEARAGLD
ncbi:c-type cytochrome [Rhodothalassium salexigens]|uniref:c-type cytochrome n=1 Tax=Rhodothalassium salexigens TaxID=1086 RepID=UPI0019115624|nr:cytochrome c [Rhodothalassium salexigens]